MRPNSSFEFCGGATHERGPTEMVIRRAAAAGVAGHRARYMPRLLRWIARRIAAPVASSGDVGGVASQCGPDVDARAHVAFTVVAGAPRCAASPFVPGA